MADQALNRKIQGFQGFSGPQGVQGVQGITASDGAQGRQGSQGIRQFSPFIEDFGSYGTSGATERTDQVLAPTWSCYGNSGSDVRYSVSPGSFTFDVIAGTNDFEDMFVLVNELYELPKKAIIEFGTVTDNIPDTAGDASFEFYLMFFSTNRYAEDHLHDLYSTASDSRIVGVEALAFYYKALSRDSAPFHIPFVGAVRSAVPAFDTTTRFAQAGVAFISGFGESPQYTIDNAFSVEPTSLILQDNFVENIYSLPISTPFIRGVALGGAGGNTTLFDNQSWMYGTTSGAGPITFTTFPHGGTNISDRTYELDFTVETQPDSLPDSVPSTQVEVFDQEVGDSTYQLLIDGRRRYFREPGYIAMMFRRVSSDGAGPDIAVTGSIEIKKIEFEFETPGIGVASTHLPGVQGDSTTGGDGYRGFQGNLGLIGLYGAQGSQGFQGAQGSYGPQGAQGEQPTTGLQGSQGSRGDPALPLTILFDPDPDNDGFVLSQAYTWGFQGSQGLEATAAPGGMQGYQGTQGPQGPQGSGPQGLQGFQGNQGPQSSSDQGVQGLQGYKSSAAQGAQGVQGWQGPQGQSEVGPRGLTHRTVQEGITYEAVDELIVFDDFYNSAPYNSAATTGVNFFDTSLALNGFARGLVSNCQFGYSAVDDRNNNGVLVIYLANALNPHGITISNDSNTNTFKVNSSTQTMFSFSVAANKDIPDHISSFCGMIDDKPSPSRGLWFEADHGTGQPTWVARLADGDNNITVDTGLTFDKTFHKFSIVCDDQGVVTMSINGSVYINSEFDYDGLLCPMVGMEGTISPSNPDEYFMIDYYGFRMLRQYPQLR